MTALLRRLAPDRFLLLLVATIGVASLLPARGAALDAIGSVSTAAIVTLFFFHGVRLSRRAVLEGLTRWRLQLAILAIGYAFMPLLGLGASQLMGGALGIGLLYLCVLPTTVQSSIAYSSIAGGNVAASVIASAASNILGVILALALFALLASAQRADAGLGGIGKIVALLLLPFALGQLARPLLAGWANATGRSSGIWTSSPSSSPSMSPSAKR